MKNRTAARIAILMGLAAWSQACGGDDDAVTPAPDGGVDSGALDSGTSDTGTPPPFDAGDAGPRDSGPDADGGSCNGGAVGVTAITPQFGTAATTTALTIRGTGFVSTPRVVLVSAGGVRTPASSTGFVSSTSLTAVVPIGLAVGKYDVVVENANVGDCAGKLAGSFKVVANPVPQVLSVAPAQATTQNDVPVTITGCNFAANATLATVNEAGTVVTHVVAGAPVAGANDARCNDTPLFTLTGTIQAKTKTLAVGAYVVRVGSPTDETFGDYASFVLSNPSGNLAAPWQAGPSLVTARRSLAVTSARLDDANRYLVAVGGENAAGTALSSVEVAPLDRFGKLGAWSVQSGALTVARSGLAVVQRGLYVYAIGGTSAANGTAGTAPTGAPLASIERAKLLQPGGAPKLAAPTVTAGTGTLAKGTYYYRVSAVLDGADPTTKGETIASEQAIVTLDAAGQIVLNWTAPTVGTAVTYRVYRTAAANGASGQEVLLADNVAATTYTDNGSATAGTAKPLSTGALGPWTTSSVSLNHARSNTTATIAADPNGALHVYVAGGWGQCALAVTNALMNCYEHATISSDGATLGAFVDGITNLTTARMRHGADVLTDDTRSFVVVAGGKGANASSTTVESAVVLAGGTLGTWANPGGFSSDRDGTRLLIANGYAYALFGGTAPNYSQTSDQSSPKAITTATSLTFSNWNNAGANFNPKLGRHGATAESAYFYVVGGTTTDTDVLATTIQILH